MHVPQHVQTALTELRDHERLKAAQVRKKAQEERQRLLEPRRRQLREAKVVLAFAHALGRSGALKGLRGTVIYRDQPDRTTSELSVSPTGKLTWSASSYMAVGRWRVNTTAALADHVGDRLTEIATRITSGTVWDDITRYAERNVTR